MATITATDVKALRERTGAGMMDCKTALTEANGDMEEAITILRKKGMAQVAKKAGRTMKEGLVGRPPQRRRDRRRGRRGELRDRLRGADAGVPGPRPGGHRRPARRPLDRGPAGAGRGRRLRRPEGGREDRHHRREHGDLARGALHRATGLVGSYLHAPAGAEGGEAVGGKIGVLVELQGVPADARGGEAVQKLVREVAMQIAAASPSYATREEVPASIIEQEKNIYRAQMENSGKPANVIEKIVDGKLGSYYGVAVLPDQPSIRDPKTTVAQVIAEAAKTIGGPLTVSRFVRFKVGESA